MQLNELKNNKGASKSKFRKARGIGSGKGKTAGRGIKGQKSRSGVAIKGFEGGQQPLYRRLPRIGFNNKMFMKVYALINTGDIEKLIADKKLKATEVITADLLKAKGIISKVEDGLKVLGKGELKTAVKIEAVKISKSAAKMIEKAGGSVKLPANAEKVRKLPKKEEKRESGRKARVAAKIKTVKTAKAAK